MSRAAAPVAVVVVLALAWTHSAAAAASTPTLGFIGRFDPNDLVDKNPDYIWDPDDQATCNEFVLEGIAYGAQVAFSDQKICHVTGWRKHKGACGATGLQEFDLFLSQKQCESAALSGNGDITVCCGRPEGRSGLLGSGSYLLPGTIAASVLGLTCFMLGRRSRGPALDAAVKPAGYKPLADALATDKAAAAAPQRARSRSRSRRSSSRNHAATSTPAVNLTTDPPV